jgi:hypothetical protein
VVAVGSSASGNRGSVRSSGQSVSVLIHGAIMTRMTSSLQTMSSHRSTQMTPCRAAVMTRRSTTGVGSADSICCRCRRGARGRPTAPQVSWALDRRHGRVCTMWSPRAWHKVHPPRMRWVRRCTFYCCAARGLHCG